MVTALMPPTCIRVAARLPSVLTLIFLSPSMLLIGNILKYNINPISCLLKPFSGSWLPYRMKYKPLSTAHKTLHELAPANFSSLLSCPYFSLTQECSLNSLSWLMVNYLHFFSCTTFSNVLMALYKQISLPGKVLPPPVHLDKLLMVCPSRLSFGIECTNSWPFLPSSVWIGCSFCMLSESHACCIVL